MKVVKISPSGLGRMLHCPKSMLAPPSYTTSPAAERGTQLHKQAEQLLKHEISEKEVDKNIREYVDLVSSLHGDIKVEHKIDNFADFFPKATSRALELGYELKSAGYIDALVINETEAFVIDLKTGSRSKVEADTEQLLAYSIAITQQHSSINKVTSIIIQPWMKHISTCERSREEIIDIQNLIDMTLLHNIENITEAVKDKDHCQWCTLKPECYKLSRKRHGLF